MQFDNATTRRKQGEGSVEECGRRRREGYGTYGVESVGAVRGLGQCLFGSAGLRS